MSAFDFLPTTKTLSELQAAVKSCEGCDLYQHATQAVFGEGPASSAIMLIGEQPGNEEDLVGRPFVGPAGRWLNKALVEAELERTDVYVTNVVKHFKWEERGVRRLHKKPTAREVKACSPWLDTELAVVKARVIVCLGASAAQSLLGKDFRITTSRGKQIEWHDGRWAIATWHPSAILRAPEAEQRASMHRELVTDLCNAKALNKQER